MHGDFHYDGGDYVKDFAYPVVEGRDGEETKEYYDTWLYRNREGHLDQSSADGYRYTSSYILDFFLEDHFWVQNGHIWFEYESSNEQITVEMDYYGYPITQYIRREVESHDEWSDFHIVIEQTDHFTWTLNGATYSAPPVSEQEILEVDINWTPGGSIQDEDGFDGYYNAIPDTALPKNRGVKATVTEAKNLASSWYRPYPSFSKSIQTMTFDFFGEGYADDAYWIGILRGNLSYWDGYQTTTEGSMSVSYYQFGAYSQTYLSEFKYQIYVKESSHEILVVHKENETDEAWLYDFYGPSGYLDKRIAHDIHADYSSYYVHQVTYYTMEYFA